MPILFFPWRMSVNTKKMLFYDKAKAVAKKQKIRQNTEGLFQSTFSKIT
jgi:hypothetical protein